MMKTGILAQLNHGPPWSVFVPTMVQSEVENIMLNLGFGCTDYNLRFANMELLPNEFAAVVEFEWPGAAMGSNVDAYAKTHYAGWLSIFADAPDIDLIIDEAIKNRKKRGKGWSYPFRCNKAQAMQMERITRDLGDTWSRSSESNTRREGKELIDAADRINASVGGTGS